MVSFFILIWTEFSLKNKKLFYFHVTFSESLLWWKDIFYFNSSYMRVKVWRFNHGKSHRAVKHLDFTWSHSNNELCFVLTWLYSLQAFNKLSDQIYLKRLHWLLLLIVYYSDLLRPKTLNNKLLSLLNDLLNPEGFLKTWLLSSEADGDFWWLQGLKVHVTRHSQILTSDPFLVFPCCPLTAADSTSPKCFYCYWTCLVFIWEFTVKPQLVLIQA